MMNSIDNYEIYLTRMSKTFFDKAWFMSHLTEDIDTIIDFGCADGSFMQFLQLNCPGYNYIGIDNDPEMQKLTKEKGFKCYSSLDDIMFVYKNQKTTCLVLNSVIHELYSYGEKRTLDDIFYFHPNCIAIRDMMFSPIDSTRFYLPLDDDAKIRRLFAKKYPKQFKEFSDIWHDKQEIEVEIAHFLLKYMYVENWEREVKENYLPIEIKNLRNLFVANPLIPRPNYKVDFQSYYKLPYLVNRWKKDFELDKNFELNEFVRNINTHFKMLLKTEQY